MLSSYKELRVWSRSVDLVIEIYKLTKSFPREEIYGITSQMRRAAVAIPSNIAEGYNRGHLKEYIQFLRIALASATELETQLIVSEKLRYLSDPDFKRIESITIEVMKMLRKLLIKLCPKP
ncbi:MAG: four helix bundle protein [Candidatus Liptonbacteria bacterium]|nr:four helix bundle protein [Candidatus Liptonbacteria bacterium]